jgi:hypothetical protein
MIEYDEYEYDDDEYEYDDDDDEYGMHLITLVIQLLSICTRRGPQSTRALSLLDKLPHQARVVLFS